MHNTLTLPPPFRVFVIVLLLLPSYSDANISTPQYTQQQSVFLEAERALEKDDLDRFNALIKSLQNYPLYPDLLYKSMQRRVNQLSQSDIDAFAQAFPGTRATVRLQQSWLKNLAKKKQWNAYLDNWKPTKNTTLQCHYLNALFNTGQQQKAFEKSEPLWLVGHSQNRACDRVFTAWEKNGGIGSKLIWKRIKLAMKNGNLPLASHLAKNLNKTDQHWVALWKQAYKNPRFVLNKKKFRLDHPIRSEIFVNAIEKTSKKSGEHATTLWKKLSVNYRFSPDAKARIKRTIAMAHVVNHHPDALKWLSSIPETHVDKEIRDWRIRMALRNENWSGVRFWIHQLPDNEKKSERWRYWLARALEATGNHDQAQQLYEITATSRDFYGFLAADKIGTPYQFSDYPLIFPQSDYKTIEHISGFKEAREYYQLNRLTEARNHWWFMARNMDQKRLKRAAKIAQSWGWHHTAIFTLAKTDYRDDLNLRFPVNFEKTVAKEAERHNLDSAWVYAIIRRESAFNIEARSRSGALGLMQLMPKTGKYIANIQNTRLRSQKGLLNANLNIQLGTAYMKYVLDKLDGNTVLAIAAYNAGPNRIRNWIPEHKSIPADIWLETLPIRETRKYLRAVLAYTAVYEKRLGQPQTRLSDRMPPIQSENMALAMLQKNGKQTAQ